MDKDKGLIGYGASLGIRKDEIEFAIKAFNFYDKDGSNSIDIEELTALLCKFPRFKWNTTLIMN